MAELRRDVLLEPERTGETVAEICRRYGISRQTWYRYRRRYLAEGLDGLEDRSRAPMRSPGQIDPDLELEICRMRKDHWRWGARRAIASWSPTGEAAWDCFELAASRHGLPRQVLSDNALSFTGRLHGTEVAFERSLKELGVQLINSGPYHPETLGKLERFHKTLKQWFADEGPPHDLDHLQELLDGFRHHYNRQRPHQAIGNLTPAERFTFSPPVAEAISTGVDDMGEPVYPPRSLIRKVTKVGNIAYRGVQITVGKRWAHGRVRVLPVGNLVHIYYGEELVRVLALDQGARYAPLGKGVTRKKPVT